MSTGYNAQPLPAEAAAAAVNRFEAADKAYMRKRLAFLVALLLAVVVASLCLSSAEVAVMYSPAEVFPALATYLRLYMGNILGIYDAMDWAEAYAANSILADVGTRAGVTLITGLCGALLAMAGTLYQNVFRNPIAAPTMLGVSNGVQLGIVVLVVQFGSSAAYLTGLYYLYTYLGAVVVLLVVLVCGKLISGRGRFNVVDMLLVASIISQLCGFITTYVSTYLIDEDVWQAFYEITEAIVVNTSFVSYASLLVTALVTLIPVYCLRFSLNMVSFTDEEARLSGVDPTHLRIVALVCGTLMVLTAQVHCGLISMVSLVVPHISRAFLGANFKRQFWGNLLIGMVLLLVCRFVTGCIPFVENGLPIGTVVAYVTLPVYVWMMAAAQKTWRD